MRIAVIGAGIVGVSCALELVRDGHQVTMIDPGPPGGRQSASYGHGCWISPASVVPMSMPGLWKQVPGYLLNPRGPLVIRWRFLPRLLPWLLRFLLAGSTVRRVERTARALAALLADSPARHAALAAQAGVPELIRQDGLLYAYPDRVAFEAEALSWHLRRITGLRWQELDRAALEAREPDLAPHYRFGVLAVDGGHCTDAGQYVAALAAAAQAGGATLLTATATGFVFSGDRLAAVSTDAGRVDCDRAVLAGGVWSRDLARQCGDSVPMESERGYHSVLTTPAAGPRYPVMPSDGRMANTPTTAGLRLSGQVELASVTADPDWRRADILTGHAVTTYPGLAAAGAPVTHPVAHPVADDRWMGHRPSTPDGLPVIGRSARSADVVYAFGHGHVGFASGPKTGRLVADQLAGGGDDAALAPYAAARFRR
ncbi:NAD(P)/FAD-dependent oxidoreductase [Novispirillum itersonii]|uniref:D-amino-acid dehydrogenase n=1 Tax=Novispirillum itersonii TaxID=189 RepID=A0A7W9ZI31_NOVIT|nr:FAD-binding oxidoreductase [Novispirillum itersonii]MBB6211047.1 D-amino-acid dehydrogenase [Novispirillum itersonii]